MAIKEIKRFNNGLNEFLSKFICDSVLDLTNMPTSENGVVIGSTVLCLENKTEYMLSNSDEWLEFDIPKATLIDGKVPAEQLPSYVDDILEYESLAEFPSTGEKGKIYIALDTGFTYRWSGSMYVSTVSKEVEGGVW